MSEKNLQTTQTAELTDELGHLPRINPPVDIFENDEGYLIRADVPGAVEDAIDLRYDKGELVFEAKREYEMPGNHLAQEFGSVLYRRAFRIPEAIDAGKIEARLRHGILELTLPKTEELKPRQIPITTG